MRNHYCWSAVVLVTIAVIGCAKTEVNWIVGSKEPISVEDQRDYDAASRVLAQYVGAWVRQDYRQTYDLSSRHATPKYETYRKFAHGWRTVGFSRDLHATIRSSDASPSQIDLITRLRVEGTQMMLAVAAVDPDTVDLVKAKSWPERVMLLRVSVAGKPCGVFMGKEGDKWLVLNQPGQWEGAMPGFWQISWGRVSGRRLPH
jgi:hypothetical protein